MNTEYVHTRVASLSLSLALLSRMTLELEYNLLHFDFEIDLKPVYWLPCTLCNLLNANETLNWCCGFYLTPISYLPCLRVWTLEFCAKIFVRWILYRFLMSLLSYGSSSSSSTTMLNAFIKSIDYSERLSFSPCCIWARVWYGLVFAFGPIYENCIQLKFIVHLMEMSTCYDYSFSIQNQS